MLNRTNRTLSAQLNRLNLGTRSLAPVARFNTSASTLHFRPVHPVVTRAGVVGVPEYPIPKGIIGIPSIPGSPAVSPWLIASCAVHPRVDSGADARPAGPWQPQAMGLSCLRGEKRGAEATRRLPGRGQSGRKPFMGQRQQPASLAGMSWPAILSPMAAARAAAARG
jgi:hypothetical protein